MINLRAKTALADSEQCSSGADQQGCAKGSVARQFSIRAWREPTAASRFSHPTFSFEPPFGGMMTSGLSRRALLSAFVPSTSDETLVRVASIGADCVELKGVNCRRCGEVCDENAIRFMPMGGGRAAPVLNATMCSGCAECLAPCPVSAITLTARDTALLAREAALLEARP
jgi:ferredoxin-type protein NapF